MGSRDRQPCPDRILDDAGGAFGMGVVGGSIFHFFRGMYNSPRGERFLGGSQGIRMNAPRIGGSFAAWGCSFSVFDCAMVFIRQKEDPWNSIIAGAATGGLLSMRQGLRIASRSMLFGGVLLAGIEGASIALDKYVSLHSYLPEEDFYSSDFPQNSVTSMVEEEGSSSWFGGFFGKKKEEKNIDHSRTEILESFDDTSDPPSIPSFDYK